MQLSDLRRANAARHIEWTGGRPVPMLFRMTELGGEVGEALNVAKKIERERLGWPGSRDTLDHLAEELSDVIICVDLCAMNLDIDLGLWVPRKFNMTSEKVGLKARL